MYTHDCIPSQFSGQSATQEFGKAIAGINLASRILAGVCFEGK